jgi:hypothetical protein
VLRRRAGRGSSARSSTSSSILHVGEHGYTEVMVPYIAHRNVAEGTGQLPKFEPTCSSSPSR